MNWARKPGWRIAANDRLVDDAVTGAVLVSLIKKPLAALCEGHIRQRDALDMFEQILDCDITVCPPTMSMVLAEYHWGRCCMAALMIDRLAHVSSSSNRSSSRLTPFNALSRHDTMSARTQPEEMPL